MAERKQKTMRVLEREVSEFNARFEVGSPVVYRSHPDAQPLDCRVTSPAFVLSGHTACVQLDKVSGVVGCFAVSSSPPGAAAE